MTAGLAPVFPQLPAKTDAKEDIKGAQILVALSGQPTGFARRLQQPHRCKESPSLEF
jgi:hypothetical protein